MPVFFSLLRSLYLAIALAGWSIFLVFLCVWGIGFAWHRGERKGHLSLSLHVAFLEISPVRWPKDAFIVWCLGLPRSRNRDGMRHGGSVPWWAMITHLRLCRTPYTTLGFLLWGLAYVLGYCLGGSKAPRFQNFLIELKMLSPPRLGIQSPSPTSTPSISTTTILPWISRRLYLA